MSRRDIDAIVTIVRTLHREMHFELDCDHLEDDATDDHAAEVALAGQIIMDLRRDGLIVSKARARHARLGAAEQEPDDG